MQQSKAPMKPGQQRRTKVMNNQTMANMMKQKTGGEEWKTARQKLIKEALKKKPNFIKEPKKKRY
jgi:hypothetical protein